MLFDSEVKRSQNAMKSIKNNDAYNIKVFQKLWRNDVFSLEGCMICKFC